MSDREARRKGGRRVQLEFLEGRVLLSAAAVPHAAAEVTAFRAAPVRAVVARGRAFGTVTPILNVGPVNTSFNGQGSANAIGAFGLTGQQQTDLGATVRVSNGSITLTTANGSQIQIVYNGSARLPRRGNPSLNLVGAVVGGTGVYAGASGTFSGTVTQGGGANGFALSFTLRLNPRR